MADRTSELERALDSANTELVTTTARFEEARKEIRPRAARKIAELQAELDSERALRADVQLRTTEAIESARAQYAEALAQHEIVLARHEVASDEREAALADREQELAAALGRLSEMEETLAATAAGLARAEEAGAVREQEAVALREQARQAAESEQAHRLEAAQAQAEVARLREESEHRLAQQREAGRAAALGEHGEELAAAQQRLAEVEAALATALHRMQGAEAARSSLEQQLREHERWGGRSGQRLAGERERRELARRRLTEIDERLTAAISMMPTIVVRDQPPGDGATGMGAIVPARCRRRPRRTISPGRSSCASSGSEGTSVVLHAWIEVGVAGFWGMAPRWLCPAAVTNAPVHSGQGMTSSRDPLGHQRGQADSDAVAQPDGGPELRWRRTLDLRKRPATAEGRRLAQGIRLRRVVAGRSEGHRSTPGAGGTAGCAVAARRRGGRHHHDRALVLGRPGAAARAAAGRGSTAGPPAPPPPISSRGADAVTPATAPPTADRDAELGLHACSSNGCARSSRGGCAIMESQVASRERELGEARTEAERLRADRRARARRGADPGASRRRPARRERAAMLQGEPGELAELANVLHDTRAALAATQQEIRQILQDLARRTSPSRTRSVTWSRARSRRRGRRSRSAEAERRTSIPERSGRSSRTPPKNDLVDGGFLAEGGEPSAGGADDRERSSA